MILAFILVVYIIGAFATMFAAYLSLYEGRYCVGLGLIWPVALVVWLIRGIVDVVKGRG